MIDLLSLSIENTNKAVFELSAWALIKLVDKDAVPLDSFLTQAFEGKFSVKATLLCWFEFRDVVVSVEYSDQANRLLKFYFATTDLKHEASCHINHSMKDGELFSYSTGTEVKNPNPMNKGLYDCGEWKDDALTSIGYKEFS